MSGIASLAVAQLRLAGRKEPSLLDRDLEILRLQGSLCLSGSHIHIHITVANAYGSVLGSHLCGRQPKCWWRGFRSGNWGVCWIQAPVARSWRSGLTSSDLVFCVCVNGAVGSWVADAEQRKTLLDLVVIKKRLVCLIHRSDQKPAGAGTTGTGTAGIRQVDPLSIGGIEDGGFLIAGEAFTIRG